MWLVIVNKKKFICRWICVDCVETYFWRTCPFATDCRQMLHKEEPLFSSELKPHLFYGATVYMNRVVTWQRSLSTSSRLVYCLVLGWLTLPPTTALPQRTVLLTNCFWIWETHQPWEPGLTCWSYGCTSCKNNELVKWQCSYTPSFAGRNSEVNIRVPSAKPHFIFWVHKIFNRTKRPSGGTWHTRARTGFLQM
jgi:hypothetical protein